MEEKKKDIDFTALAENNAPSKGSKAVTFLLLLICIALAAAIIIKMFSQEEQAELKAAVDDSFSAVVNVDAVPAAYGTFSKISRLNGEISREGNDITILPDITSSGIVTEVLIKEGDTVSAGDIIAYIDPSRPGQSFMASPVVAKASGIVSDLAVSVGEMAGASTVIATLTSNEDLIITASVPEKFIGSLRPGMSALFESVAYPDRMYEGTLSYISPNLNRQSRSADIKIDITGSTEGLMDGMYIKLNLETEHIDNAMIVPSAALDTYLGDDVVYVVEDGAAVRKTVETGSSNDTETVILSGLDEGELVITAGNVTNGTPVNVV